MKKYTVEFTLPSGTTYEFQFLTENIKKSISEYCRNREIVGHKILNEDTSNTKSMLFG